MPPPHDSDTSPPSPPSQSNKNIAAETVVGPVMAEQTSHNVVDSTQSMSASAPVDVAANQTNADSADQGATDPALPQAKPDELQTTQSTTEQVVNNNATASSILADANSVDAAAEPSAGEAVGTADPATANNPTTETPQSQQATDAPVLHDVDGPNGVVDDGADHGRGLEGSADASLNSDNEGSKGDGSEEKKDDDKHHTRSQSVKKPTTFSKVNISKSYLAKSAAAPPTAKAGEKPSPAGTPPAQAVARPRLIAKTGASVQQKVRLGSDAAAGPDASRVWNKNRPVAPPPPKQFTDEELKQQYGIHLATRLQGDETGKEAKWADIDDDEDDWAPDAVVWMDGTKSSLTPQEAASSLEQQKPASPQPQKLAEVPRPILALKKPTESGPPKTILKPGASAAAAQAKQGGIGAGTPTGKAPSPAPPSKSPWAALPPVEKVSPINPPVQQVQQPHQPPLRLATQDARAYETPQQQQPTREIAADTFDRSWREGEGGARELFNSVSGRYEPVTADGRRSSIRPDSSMRKPSLLQRSSQTVISPAEPSSAFQTRSNQMDGSWARRRGSSISQGSLPQARRVSTSKGSDMSPAPERRTSTVVGHDMRSPQMTKPEPAQPTQPVFAQQSAWQQQMPARPESSTEQEELLKAQDRVMREKRELAKKRRKEEEDREEAERRKRLEARLAGLAGAGKSRSQREAEAAAAKPAAKAASPATELPSEVTTSTEKAEATRGQPSQPAEVAATVAPALEAQSLPVPPSAPQPMQSTSDDHLPSPLPQKPHFANLPERPVSSSDQQRHQSRLQPSPKANARAPFQAQPSPYGPPPSSYSSPGDRKPQQFGRSPMPNNDSFSPWPTTAPNSNVWGTAGIGNGTFASSNTFAPMQQTSGALPPPPGMSHPSNPNRISPQSLTQGSRSPNMQQQPLSEPHRGFGPPGFENRQDAFAGQPRANGNSPVPGLARPPHPPGPIGPPSRAQAQPNQAQQAPPQHGGPHENQLRAWNRASVDLPNQYRSAAEGAGKPRDAAATNPPPENTIKETFKKTSPNQKLGAPRRYHETEYTIHEPQGSRSVQSLSPAPPHAQTQPAGPILTASPHQDLGMENAENKVRIPDGSLNAAHGGNLAQQPPIGRPSTQQYQQMPGQTSANRSLPPPPSATDISPPPPEDWAHPVNSGDTKHPLVRLPQSKPKVKLPPAPMQVAEQGVAHQQQAIMMPQRPISNLGAPGRPIAQSSEWQQRFNGLFGRTAVHTETPPSPPKTPPKMQGPALAIDASSRPLMDEMPIAAGAMVSLPQAKKATSPEGFTIDESSDVVSKPAIDATFAEDLTFGSKPRVHVPRNAKYNDALYHGAATTTALRLPHEYTAVARSVTPFDASDVHRRSKDGIYIHLPQFKIGFHLVRDPRAHRHASGNNDRRPSGRFNNQKPRGGPPSAATANNNAQNNESKSVAPPSQAAASSSTQSNDARKSSSNWEKPPNGRYKGARPYVHRAPQAQPVSNSGW